MARGRRRQIDIVIDPLGQVRAAGDDAWMSWEIEYAETRDPCLLALAIALRGAATDGNRSISSVE